MWGGMVKDYLLTDEEKKKLSEEIDQIRAEGFKRAQDICNQNADLIGYLVKALVEDGILLGSELDELIVKFNESKQTVN
jgi:ATP-dependent Zn protease